MKILAILLGLMYPLLLIGQKLNHKIEIDIDFDSKKELLLFYDSFNGEFEKTEFTKFCIVSGADTSCVDNEDTWVEKPDLYLKADKKLDNRVGILREQGKIFLWLTGYEYGCCINKTTILEWTGKSLIKIYEDEFEVWKILLIDGKKYIVGSYALTEEYGDKDSDFYFTSFYPTEYRLLDDSMRVDRQLTSQNNLGMKSLEEIHDAYDVFAIVHINHNGEQIMISHEMESSLQEREFGILSLTKLKKEFFNKVDNQKLRLMRNELFAYHGYSFNSKDLLDYFKTKKWYKPTQKTVETISSELSEIERYNIDLIQGIEKDRM